jgi:hypothetical protein
MFHRRLFGKISDGLKSNAKAASLCLALAVACSVGSAQYIMETRTGGLNVADFISTGTADSSAKSTAAGLTAGIGSKYNTMAAPVGKVARWTPSGITAGTYLIEFTQGSAASAPSGPVTYNVKDGSGIVQTGTFTYPATANAWIQLGASNFTLDPAQGSYIEFDCATATVDGTKRAYYDALRLTLQTAGVNDWNLY